MRKCDELRNSNSCLSKAETDEPLFVLRANDENAPAIVIAWARDYMESKGGWTKLTESQKKKYNEACNIASDMRVWKMQQNQRRK